MRFHSAYDYDRDRVSRETGTSFEGEESLAIQSAKDECDINTIVRRFGVTGVLPEGARSVTYLDFDGVFDFQTAMNAVRSAQDAFMALDADVRQRFYNDPQRFVEFCSKPENIDELRRMGLADPAPKVDDVSAVPVAKEKDDVSSARRVSKPAKASGKSGVGVSSDSGDDEGSDGS